MLKASHAFGSVYVISTPGLIPTDAQAAWLTKLRDEGPQSGALRSPVATNCYRRGWTENCDWSRPGQWGREYFVLQAGLDALARWEARRHV